MNESEYRRTMSHGVEQYRDALHGLQSVGLEGEFTQNGGMCAALGVVLDGGHHLLLTDVDSPLAWSRSDHDGWFVGLYEPDGRQVANGPLLRWAYKQ